MEKELEIHSSILVWGIPWTEEPGGLQSTGSQRVGDRSERPNSGIICKELSSGHSGPCQVASYAELVPGSLWDCTAPFLFPAPAGFGISTGHFQGHVQPHLTSPVQQKACHWVFPELDFVSPTQAINRARLESVTQCVQCGQARVCAYSVVSSPLQSCGP